MHISNASDSASDCTEIVNTIRGWKIGQCTFANFITLYPHPLLIQLVMVHSPIISFGNMDSAVAKKAALTSANLKM